MVIDLTLHIWFIVSGFLLAASIISHSVRYWREAISKCKSNYKAKKIAEQTLFLMSGNYNQLYSFAKEVKLVTKRIKKEELCALIANYQLG